MAVHELPLERRTLHGHFSRELEPVLSIDPGDSVAFRTLNAGWRGDDPKSQFEPRDPELDEGHALCGPIEVCGARAGALLEVAIGEIRVGGWGVTFSREPHLLEWALDADAGTGRDQLGRTVRLSPFLGVLGMPPSEPGRHSTGPPRRSGGNMDCKELLAGTTLWLPIPVDGALFSAGDGHALQGDGEVSGTAIECPVERAELTFELRDDFELKWPLARTPTAWIALAFDEDLTFAAEEATAGILDLMQRELGVERNDALALASLLVDLRVTQIVNGVRGVHAVLPFEAIERL